DYLTLEDLSDNGSGNQVDYFDNLSVVGRPEANTAQTNPTDYVSPAGNDHNTGSVPVINSDAADDSGTVLLQGKNSWSAGAPFIIQWGSTMTSDLPLQPSPRTQLRSRAGPVTPRVRPTEWLQEGYTDAHHHLRATEERQAIRRARGIIAIGLGPIL